MGRRALILLCTGLCLPAWGAELTLSVSTAERRSAPGAERERVSLGVVNTQVGEPAIGRRIRADDGAHFVVPMSLRAAVERARPHPRAARSVRGRPIERTRLAALPEPLRDLATEVDVYVHLAGPLPPHGDVRLARSRAVDWSRGPRVGRQLGAHDLSVGTVSAAHPELPHEVSLYATDRAWGSMSATLVYTAVPH